MTRGKNGAVKEQILHLLYRAEQIQQRLSVSQLAIELSVKPNTISGHLRDLSESSPGCGRISPLVEESMTRGYWRLTAEGRKRVQLLHPHHNSIPYRGYIAAGPAIPLGDENLDDFLNTDNLDPETHFAFKVRGNSMVSYHICDGDVVIFRRADNFEYIQEGSIVAVLVPEGTDITMPHWHERLIAASQRGEAVDLPALDHITLKEMDEGLRRLRGSQGIVQPPAMQVIGVLARVQRDCNDGRVLSVRFF